MFCSLAYQVGLYRVLPVWLARILLLLMILGLPLSGAWLAGQPLKPYLEFPPVPESWKTKSFSWPLFVAAALAVVGMVAPLVFRVITEKPHIPVRPLYPTSFPYWGWWGVGLVAFGWILAWNRFSWFAPLQPYTFTLLWIGYILVVNGLTLMRAGRCLLVDYPRHILILFPLSAIFWWFFEYLNLFAQNWYYVGGSEPSGGMKDFLISSLPFSTVLPAVLSTRDLLASFPRLSAGLGDYYQVPVPFSRLLPWMALLLGVAGLLGIPIWPAYLFPAVWIAPVLLIVALQTLAGQNTLFSHLKQGDWRPVWLPALAGLVCGFFWEMWNYYSLSRWEYVIPQVHGFALFEMPLLGYAGYLPFGLICLITVEFFLPERFNSNKLVCPQSLNETQR